jgi:hypothetical protein
MEPITVIELDGWAEDFLKKHRNIRIPIQLPFEIIPCDAPPIRSIIPYVEITAEAFVRNGEKHLMLFAKDEESALMLKSVFLPGQRKELREAERMAAARGAFEFVSMLRQALR